MKKLLIAVGLGLLSGSLWAACHGPFCYDDSGTSSISGNVAIAGTLTIGIVDVTLSTPTATGLLARNSSNILYMSTATATPSSWQKVGAQ